MIPAIALMIAIYGCARLVNDTMARYPNNDKAEGVTWINGLLAGIALWAIALYMNFSASTP